MSLSLKLELKPQNRVLVTNLQTNESKEVSLGFIQDTAHDSLSMLVQYKYYELLRNTETIWSIVKHYNVAAAVEQASFKTKATSLVLKLELDANNEVLVTNLQTNKSRTVSMRYMLAIAGRSLDLLVQNRYYELLINTQDIWQKVERFDPKVERIEEITLDQKFRDIMVNDQWLKITDHDRQMYNKALASWANTYNSQLNKPSFDKFVFAPVAGGAIAGALTYSKIGGLGVAAAGTAFGLGAVGFTALGTIGGLAVYGVGKAFA